MPRVCSPLRHRPDRPAADRERHQRFLRDGGLLVLDARLAAPGPAIPAPIGEIP